jgi:hypothetical protein
MDTDEFSDMAYNVIVQAARVSDTLKAELGAMSRIYKNEDDWLRGVQVHLRDILANAKGYVELWNLQEFENVTVNKIRQLATNLNRQAEEVPGTPLSQRGVRGW